MTRRTVAERFRLLVKQRASFCSVCRPPGEQDDIEERGRHVAEFLQVATRGERRGRRRPTTPRYSRTADQVHVHLITL